MRERKPRPPADSSCPAPRDGAWLDALPPLDPDAADAALDRDGGIREPLPPISFEPLRPGWEDRVKKCLQLLETGDREALNAHFREVLAGPPAQPSAKDSEEPSA